MQRPRRKQFNPINAPALVRWIMLTGFLAAAGLIYVYVSVQLYHLGDKKRKLENELVALHSQNEMASVQIAALTSRSALQLRLNKGYLKMIPIPDTSIVRLTSPTQREDAVQPVVNQRGGR